MSLIETTQLIVHDGSEPTIRDLDLATALGMAQPLNIRTTIQKNMAELKGFGPIHAAREMVEIGSGAKREVVEYHLTEPQALLLCMFARTARAAEVRRQLIDVFMAWRRGQLDQPQPITAIEERILKLIDERDSITGHAIANHTRDISPSERRRAIERLLDRGEIDFFSQHRPNTKLTGHRRFERIYCRRRPFRFSIREIDEARATEGEISYAIDLLKQATRHCERVAMAASAHTGRLIAPDPYSLP